MRHLKDITYFLPENIIENCGYYIESQLPNKYYFDWEWDPDDYNKKVISYEFYYDIDTDENTLNDIYNFFEKYDIEIEEGHGLHSLAPIIDKQIKIKIKVPKKLIVEFSELYNNIKKYNI